MRIKIKIFQKYTYQKDISTEGKRRKRVPVKKKSKQAGFPRVLDVRRF